MNLTVLTKGTISARRRNPVPYRLFVLVGEGWRRGPEVLL